MPQRLRHVGVGATIVALLAACQASDADEPARVATPTPPAAVLAAQKCAEATLEPMSREQRVGQLLMVGVEADNPTRAASWVTKYHLGGVLLTGNTTTTVGKAKKATDALHAASGDDPRPLVAVRQEGGDTQTLRGDDFFDIPSGAEQGRWDVRDTTKRTGSWANALHLAGVDLTLSPVADAVLTDSVNDNPVVGSTSRSLGTDPQAIALKVDQIVKAIQGQDVMATVRDFPGTGRLTEDPATSSDAVDDQLTIDDPQIAPFVTGIEAGADVVAISAATYPRLGEDTPAIYARAVISGLLREVIGFDGIILSADLSRTTAATTYPLKQRGVRFIQAGGDLVLSASSSRSLDLLVGMLAEDSTSPTFRDLVDDAALRVLAVKAEHGVIACS